MSDSVRALVNGVDADMGYAGGDVSVLGGDVAMQLGPGGPSATSVYTAAYVAPISGEDIWFSLLFETGATTGAAERDFFQLMFTTQAEGATNDTLSLVMDQVGSSHEFIARAGGSTSSGTGNNVSSGVANVPGTPTFLVGCLKPDASGAYNAIDLYVNPTTVAQPSTADAAASFAIANPLTSIDKIYTRTSVWETNDSVLVDELRLGKSYQDVLAIYENAVRADDPAVYFRFNGTDSDKASLEAYDLMQGMVGVGTGPSSDPQPDMNVDGPQTGMFESDNSAVAFAGSATRLKGYDPGADSVLDFDSGDTITMEAWVKVDVLPSGENSYIISKGRNEETSLQNYGLRITDADGDAGTLTLIYRNAANSDWNIWKSSETLPVGDDEWHHIALSYTFGDGESIAGYIDGDMTGGSWIRGDGNAAPHVNDETLWFGSAQAGAANSTLEGSIDEAAIYRYALTPQQIANHYALGTVPEPSALLLICLGLAAVGSVRRRS